MIETASSYSTAAPYPAAIPLGKGRRTPARSAETPMDSAVSHSMRITRKLSRALDSLRPPVPVLYREDALPTTSAALHLILVLKDTVPMDAPVTLR